MTDTTDNRLVTLLSRIGGFVAVSAPMLVALLADAKGDLTVKMQMVIPLSGAFVSVLVAWGWWTVSLVRKDSKREKVKEAHRVGRRLCACTEVGEIMTKHHATEHWIEVYCCPKCENMQVIHPEGSVAIADDTLFKPPLPGKAHEGWLARSRAGR